MLLISESLQEGEERKSIVQDDESPRRMQGRFLFLARKGILFETFFFVRKFRYGVIIINWSFSSYQLRR